MIHKLFSLVTIALICRFYKSIFNASGVPVMVAKYGDWFTHDKTPRALIFKRDQGAVRTEADMIKLMRWVTWLYVMGTK